MTKLALALSFVLMGCGLDTNGMAEDVWTDEAEPDTFETEPPDIPDFVDAESPDETPEEVENEVEAEEDAAEEAADETPEIEADFEEVGDEGSEDVPDAEDEGGEEDGEAVDPCAPPEVPTTGLYLFFCITTDRWPTNIHLERRVDRSGTGLPDVPWAVELGCVTGDTRILFCEVDLTGPGTMIFGVHLTYAWACEHLATPYAHGTPRLWWNGAELTLGEPLWNGVDGSDGCQYTVSLPTP